MSKLLLNFRLLELQPEGDPLLIAQHGAVSFDSKKILSPGIRQQAVGDLNGFLDAQSSITTLLKTEDATPAKLHAEELRRLATLIEKGDRVLEATIFHNPDHQMVVLKIDHPKSS